MVLVTDELPASTNAKVVILTEGTTGSVAGATVIETNKSSWAVAQALSDLAPVLREDDSEQVNYIKENAAKDFDKKSLETLSQFAVSDTPLMSPAAFRYKLTELARAAHKRLLYLRVMSHVQYVLQLRLLSRTSLFLYYSVTRIRS